MARTTRRAPASPAVRRAARTALALAAVVAAALTGVAPPAAAAASGTTLSSVAPAPRAARTPVIFVHGYNADPGVWGRMLGDFKAAGYTDAELFTWSYDTHASVNEVLSGRFAAYVDEVRQRTGARRVDIVAHSYGSLPTRWYLKNGGGTTAVGHWVSLGGPNHGTGLAWLCAAWDQACRDMTPGSYVQKGLAAGDETPGDVKYATFWSSCDEFIDPHDSVPLTGAVNTPAGCLKHNELLTDGGVSAGVRTFLGR
ncbi:esterase/lipase family protein [Streptomyces sp. x-80]|uniref:esterase/lipase family protein n=1 Tax=Streptomyces sp. x-80 TaxID=2789282 RepID=UPI003980C6AC